MYAWSDLFNDPENRKTCRQIVLNIKKSVLFFSTTVVWNIFHSTKCFAHYAQKRIWLSKHCSCYIVLSKWELILLNNSSQKFSNIMNSDHWFLSFLHAYRQMNRMSELHRHATWLLTRPKDAQISRKPDNTGYSMCLILEREGCDRISSMKTH